jgi:hypothetical protein
MGERRKTAWGKIAGGTLGREREAGVSRHGREGAGSCCSAPAMEKLLRGVQIMGGGSRSHGRRRAGEGAGLGAGLRKKGLGAMERKGVELPALCLLRVEEEARERRNGG